jgi:hypothetical protein
VFFGIGVAVANHYDPRFFFRFPHVCPMFLIPIVCFYMFLTVWVMRKVREALAADGHATGPSGGSTSVAGGSEPMSTNRKASESGLDTALFDLGFYPCIELIP